MLAGERGADPAIAIDERPTVLVAGAAPDRALLARWAERAGLRCIGEIALGEVPARLALTVAVDLILVDLRGAGPDGGLDRPVARALAARRGLSEAKLAVLTDLASLDCAMAWLDAPGTEMLCAPAASEIVSLLVMAALTAARGGDAPQFHDAARETEGARIEQLSDEVRRLAETIERLTLGTGPAVGAGGGRMRGGGSVMERRGSYRADAPLAEPRNGTHFAKPDGAAGGRGDTVSRPGSVAGGLATPSEIRAVLRARRLREQYLPADLFADPAWDMMLDLMAARLAGQRVSVSSLCIAAAVPPTTALRWIRQLTERGVFSRIDDPVDGRRVFIELTDEAADAVGRWAQAVRRNGGLLTSAAAR